MTTTSPGLKEAMRNVPSTVALITSRDQQGKPHGMAASAVISVSVDPPSVLVAVNQTAGIFPVVKSTGRICINFLGRHQEHLIESFSRSDMREHRFAFEDWSDAHHTCTDRLPWLPGARAVVFGEIDHEVPYGTHSLFIAKVSRVCLPPEEATERPPLVWIGGKSASLSCA